MPVMNHWHQLNQRVVQLNQRCSSPASTWYDIKLAIAAAFQYNTQRARFTPYHAWFTPLTSDESAFGIRQNEWLFDSGSFFWRARAYPSLANHSLLHPIRCRLNPKCQFSIQAILDSTPRPLSMRIGETVGSPFYSPFVSHPSGL